VGSADKIGARFLPLQKIEIFDNGAELLLSAHPSLCCWHRRRPVDRTQSGRSGLAAGTDLHPFGDLCRFIPSSRRREAAEDRCARGPNNRTMERERRFPRQRERFLPGNVGTHWIASANLTENPILQMDQNEGW